MSGTDIKPVHIGNRIEKKTAEKQKAKIFKCVEVKSEHYDS